MSSLSSDCESLNYTESEAESDYDVGQEDGQPAHYNHTLEVQNILHSHVDITTKNAVGLNHQYKAKLVVLRQQLEGLLLRCQNRLLEVDKSLDDIRLNLTPKARPSRPRHPGYICGQPFFKDHDLYPGPHNEDYLYRKNVKKEFFPLDLFESIETFWTRRDKQMLRESIATQAYEFVHRENQLRHKMCNRSDNARRIKKEWIGLKALPLADIWHQAQAYDGKYGSQKFNVDWLKISAAIMSGRHSAVTCEGMWNNFLMPGLKRCMWTSDEESKLVQAVEAHGRRNWTLIARSVENRSEYQCFVHYQTNFSELSQIKRHPWTPEEDELLMRLVKENRIGNNIIWNKVVERMPFRNKVQAYHRYKYTLLRPLRGAKFTAEEDCVITAYVQQYGDDFRYFQENLLPGRTSKQIRARYMNTLRFVNTHVGWSLEEDKRLMSYIADHFTEEGAQKISWADCSKHLGNHSRLSCRTRYYTIKRFLEGHPNAALENVPRREKKKLSSKVTDKNWIKTIVEIKSTPKAVQKPGEPFEFGRSPGIESGLYEQMKFSFRYKFGHKLAVDARTNHVFTGTKILLYLLEGFQEPSPEKLKQAKEEALLKAVLACPLDWPNLVSIMHPKMTLSGDAMLFCRIPPSYNTVLGLRGVCLNACSEQAKQTLPEQRVKKVRSFDPGPYDQAIGVFVERFRKIFHWTMLLMMLNIDDVTLEGGEHDNPALTSTTSSKATTDLQLKSMENKVLHRSMDKLSNSSYCDLLLPEQAGGTSGTSLPAANSNSINRIASITIIDPKDLPTASNDKCRANVPGQGTEFKCRQYLSEPSAAGSKVLRSTPTSIEAIEYRKPAACIIQPEAKSQSPGMVSSSVSALHSMATGVLPNTIPCTVIQVPEEISFVQQQLVNAEAHIASLPEAPGGDKHDSRETAGGTSTLHHEQQADVKLGTIEEQECPKRLNESNAALCTVVGRLVNHLPEVALQEELESNARADCKGDTVCCPVATTSEDIVMVDIDYPPTGDSMATEPPNAGSDKQDLRYVAAKEQNDTLVPYERTITVHSIVASDGERQTTVVAAPPKNGEQKASKRADRDAASETVPRQNEANREGVSNVCSLGAIDRRRPTAYRR
ncbi:uncharacterized protein LOC118517519 [Anopheles stephensi]|uniref:uncharacterized protein LOC118517519 n=1 Tax=Anopheles stephensi TaxID=30069 RepID=UPI0016587429|nr:uncharacterized protein LOC118517519 [Anopheles stephensi]